MDPAELDKAKLDPATAFATPWHVVEASGISREDKRAILVRWETDTEALIRATEEGMPPSDGRRSPAELLRAVHAALEALGFPPSPG